MSIPYDYYKIFYYAARYRSFNKAASVLSNSQPNISRSMTNLENKLGCKLFNRSKTGVTLTNAGEELYEHVEIAYRHLEAAEYTLRSTAELKHGILTIGYSVGLTQRIMRETMIPTIHLFHNTYPDIHIRILHASTHSLVSDISNNLMDLAFVTTPFEENKEGKIFKKALFKYNDIAIAGSDFSGLKNRKVSLSELADYPIIGLGPRSETFEYYRNVFAENGSEYKPDVETTSTGQILIYTIENLGIGFIHPKDAKQALDEGQIFKIDLKEKLPNRYVAMIRNIKENNAATIFEQMLTNALSAQQTLQ